MCSSRAGPIIAASRTLSATQALALHSDIPLREMSCSIQHQEQPPPNALITVSGRLLLGPGCSEMEQLVSGLLERGYRYLTFDVAGVTHIDSTGMGRFIDAYNKLKLLGGSIHVVGAKGAVRDMFRVTRLDTVFQLD